MDGDRAAIIAGITQAAPAGRRALVAIDGIGASGKTTLASAIAARITTRPVIVLHVDDFFNPAAVRHARGRLSPEGFWLDSYNHSALISSALQPLSEAGPVLYRASSFDRGTGETVVPDPVRAPADSLVLVEGTFLHRDELVGFWDHSLFLDVPFDVAAERMARRDGLSHEAVDKRRGRYDGAQQLYFRAARPWARAGAVVDTTELDRPVLIAADSAAAAGEVGLGPSPRAQPATGQGGCG